ncbi:hypothetical protein LguiB_026203 [Lonicera macranthoides]
MEGGYIITHSPALLLKERNFHLSDPYRSGALHHVLAAKQYLYTDIKSMERVFHKYISEDQTVDNISEDLNRMGYQKYGYETIYNGHTGRCLTNMIFLGLIYYQRLKHMVDVKIHSCGQGPM